VNEKMIDLIIFIIGAALMIIGAICDLIGALGFIRFPNFFVRLHAATIGAIGGAVYPLFGVALVALVMEAPAFTRYAIAGGAFVTAIIILLIAPTGSHALARATHRAKVVPVYPKICDHLEEDRGEVKEEVKEA